MIRLAFCLTAIAALTGCGSSALVGGATPSDDMWSGPPPWTSDRDDSVEPSIYWDSSRDNFDRSDCQLTGVSSADQVVAVGLYESVSLSSAAVGGVDKETNFVTVNIEAGKRPLYLVLSSYESMVWRLTGATDRVGAVAVLSAHGAENGAPASGVIGVKSNKLTFLPVKCGTLGHETGATDVLAALGIEGDDVRNVNAYSALSVGVPSGAVLARPLVEAAPPPGVDVDAWREAVRYWPGGVVMVPPKLVVSPAVVRSYRVLPSQAGIAQLVGSGELVPGGSGYRIVKPIPRFPPSMGGAHSVKFSLASGVPMPEGDLVHSCVTMEDGSATEGIPDICER